MASKATFKLEQKNNTPHFLISGRFDANGAMLIFKDLKKSIYKEKASSLIFDVKSVEYINTAGAVFFAHLDTFARINNKSIEFLNCTSEFDDQIKLAQSINIKNVADLVPEKLSFIEKKGESLYTFIEESKEFITYTGEITWALLKSFLNPRRIRWADTFIVAERAGVDALPIVALISFIVGLVMAFQAAIPMRMFGAELYVANLIGISMVRELGPLMTAIVLAGRSSSAFAAEIGTMRINEEIDALEVMGLNPVRFLIVPRIIASTFITPLLTIFSNLMGMLGGALVITSMGYPIISYYNQIATFVKWNDFAGGLLKCFVFGILIAATGCIRGYQTQSGPSAVGVSTTRAVVTGIVLIAVFDGIFSIIYFYLGI